MAKTDSAEYSQEMFPPRCSHCPEDEVLMLPSPGSLAPATGGAKATPPAWISGSLLLPEAPLPERATPELPEKAPGKKRSG